jgi:succinate dehydrogenase / fumarate reductase flavoprotein subunit
MEMVQYHPTTLGNRGILITEAVRSEGAHLVNKKGERFMERYDADAMEMSTRDVVARAALTEVRKNRGDKGHVFLDMRHVDKARMKDRLQETLWIIDDLEGLDPSDDLVPVKPGMHRPLGGIKIDTFGSTELPGLYAAGECASTGVHGANRLGGNSLLDCIVFGRRAGESASRYARGATWTPASSDLVMEQEAILNEVTEKDPNTDTPGAIRRDLGEIMDKNVGIVRSQRGLRRAANAVVKLQERHAALGIRDKSGTYNIELRTLKELGHMLDVAEVIIASAEARQESRGCHFRSDFSERDDDNWMKRIVVTRSDDGPALDYAPVEAG